MTEVDVPAAQVDATRHARAARISRRVLWACAVSGVVLVALSTLVQLWFAPFVAGIVLGGLARWWRTRARVAVVLASAAALGGWAVPLLWQAMAGLPVGETAEVAAALAGLPGGGPVVIAVTLLIAWGQGMLGAWTGRALVRP